MKLKNSKLTTSNWVITLTATLIGVFGALFLNQWVSSNNIRNQKSIAIKNILSEIEENRKNVKKSVKVYQTLMGTLQFMQKNMDEEKRLITNFDSMQIFKQDFPDVFAVEDSTLLENGKYHYKGELKVDIDFSFLKITNIAWETLKNTNLTTSFDFNCLLFLEEMENFQDEILKQERIVLEILKNPDNYDKDDYDERLLFELKVVIEFENGLLEVYRSSQEKLSNCG